MPLKFLPLLALTASFAHGGDAIRTPATDFWDNGGEYLHALLQEAKGTEAAAAAARLRATQEARCEADHPGRHTPASAARESGARPSELDMIDHAQALTKPQQREFLVASRAYYAALLEEEARISEGRAALARERGPAARLALRLMMREACANIAKLHLEAAETNARLTKKTGLDRDYAYRAFFREYRRVVGDRR